MSISAAAAAATTTTSLLSSSSLPLSIHLDETRFAVPHVQYSQPAALLITGYLKTAFPAQYGPHDQLVLTCRLHSFQDQIVRILYRDLLTVHRLQTHRHPQDNCYHTPFVFRIRNPRKLPPTMQHALAAIDYGVHYFHGADRSASGKDKPMLSAPFELYTSSVDANKYHPSTKLYWGTIKDAWRYEIETPTTIHLKQQHASAVYDEPVIMVRISSSWRHRVLHHYYYKHTPDDASSATAANVELESCLIGCRLEETVWPAKTSKMSSPVRKTVVVATHVLPAPSLSWTKPCRVPISSDNDTSVLPSVSLPHQDGLQITHDLCISLVFSGSADRLDLRAPVTVIPVGHVATVDSAAIAPVRQVSLSPSTTDDDDCDNKSRDSGVWLSC
ncbi:hypothetical protein BX666DRAFT_1931573 [Dichotomocladium elegans]|nr:hypothetical protein BX666DRAFT_1931573 [Dichotomocladium elegans]